ncbi:MAG TPA: hypothetical protein PLR41_08080 [Alphaproteobacteria bacterium]|nr:hypothetical protein [Alphaproteobacteria bacterium]
MPARGAGGGTPYDFYGIPLPEHRHANPLRLHWPCPGSIDGFLEFRKLSDWRQFVQSMNLSRSVPAIVAEKYRRAQKLYYLAWMEPDLFKVGELAALVALENALRCKYEPKSSQSLAHLLKHMCEGDGLTDELLPISRRCGAPAIGQLTGATRPTLAERRNALAHGDAFDELPVSGLLELVRDLVDYAYRT